jgi:hypothetical protein
MRRRMVMLALAALSSLALGGCPAAHNDYPSQACKTDNDCYIGERCMNNSICVMLGADMASPPKHFDMTVTDGSTP